jgi:hypothetical protein
MTACVLRFAVPPERLELDVSRYMEPEIGPTWPQEEREVVLLDLKPELQNTEKAESPMKQLDTRGFAILKHKSNALGSLQAQADWNAAYLEETTRYATLSCSCSPFSRLTVMFVQADQRGARRR